MSTEIENSCKDVEDSLKESVDSLPSVQTPHDSPSYGENIASKTDSVTNTDGEVEKQFSFHPSSICEDDPNPLTTFTPLRKKSLLSLTTSSNRSFARSSFTRISNYNGKNSLLVNATTPSPNNDIMHSINAVSKFFSHSIPLSNFRDSHLSSVSSTDKSLPNRLNRTGSFRDSFSIHVSNSAEDQSTVFDKLDLALPQKILEPIGIDQLTSIDNAPLSPDKIARGSILALDEVWLKKPFDDILQATSTDGSGVSSFVNESLSGRYSLQTRRSFSSSSTALISNIQNSADMVKGLIVDASQRADEMIDSELQRIRQDEMAQLMKAAASLALTSVPSNDNEDGCNIDETGRAKGFGFRSIKAGLKKKDIRAHTKLDAEIVPSKAEISTIVEKLSQSLSVTPKNCTSLLTAAAVAAASESPSEGSPTPRTRAKGEMEFISHNIRRSIGRDGNVGTIHEDDEGVHPAGESSNNELPLEAIVLLKKLARAATSSSLLVNTNPLRSSLSNVTSRAPSPGAVTPQSRISTPMSTPMLLKQRSAPVIHHSSSQLPSLSMSLIFKTIRSDKFIETSGYKWTNKGDSDDNTQLKPPIKEPPALIPQKAPDLPTRIVSTHNKVIEKAVSDSNGKGNESTATKLPKSSVVTLRVPARVMYRAGSLLEAGQFVDQMRKEIEVNNLMADEKLVSEHHSPMESVDRELHIENSVSTTSNLLMSRDPQKIRKASASRFRIVRLVKDSTPATDSTSLKSSSDKNGVISSNSKTAADLCKGLSADEPATMGRMMSPQRYGRTPV